MPVRFLSPEWAEALKTELNGSEDFRKASAGKKATILQSISTTDGEVRYWIVVSDGTIDLGLGEAPGAPDATISEGYDVAVALAKSELNAVTAYMTGKIKVDGNIGFLLGLVPVLQQLPPAMQRIDTDY